LVPPTPETGSIDDHSFGENAFRASSPVRTLLSIGNVEADMGMTQ
jgi:hypothetical protein